jgi:phosphate transport system protein
MAHIVKAYDAEFAELDRMTAEMGGNAEKLLAEAFAALETRDPKRAEAAISADKAIDALEVRIQERAVAMIAKWHPMADDLRHIMTVLKIAGALERIGDYARNIAKRAITISGQSHPRQLMTGLQHMTELALRQLNDALVALTTNDAEAAITVWKRDVGLDELYNSVFREMLTYMMEDPRNISLCTHLLFIARNLERIGDHTTTIAENVHYVSTGKVLEQRPKGTNPTTVMIEPEPRREAKAEQ